MKELLSPVGNIDCLMAAINGGADAIFLSGKSFGARSYAGNFTNEELSEAVKTAHLYGVKVYVTVNIIIYNEEIEQLLEYIEYLYKIGVDALLVQDIGVLNLIRKKFPNFEVHSSTQMHNHNNEMIKLLKELGVKRIVLDREMSIEEIENITNDVEKEVFIHGALCNSYSGCCLFSSMNGHRSGNRGQCVQSCRMPYRLIKNDNYVNKDYQYLLSTKELNTTNRFEELMKSSISVFKIEGRMKSPAYVEYITHIYRKLIDSYNNKNYKLTNEEEDNLKILFNREFTNGYLFKDKVMNINSSNHQGLEIGKVLEVTKDKIKIKLTKKLYQEDGIRFKESNLGMIANFIYDEKDNLINKAKEKDIIYLDNKIELKEKDILLKTSSPYLEKEILSLPNKKMTINIKVTTSDNKLIIDFIDDKNNKVSTNINVYTPINRNTTKEEIIEKISKLGTTPFKVGNIDITIPDNIFISMKELNDARRVLSSLLEEERTKVKREIIINDIELNYKDENSTKEEITVLARTAEQVEASLKENVDRIYVGNDLYNKYKDNSKVYLILPRVVKKYNYEENKVLIRELGGVSYYRDKDAFTVTDYTLNVINNHSIKYLLDNNVDRVTLSPEVDYTNLKDYQKNKVELLVYGKVELMVTKSCPIKESNICPCTKDDIYYLEDINNNKYRVLHENCLTHIMHYKNINYLDKIDYYKEIGIKSFRIDLLEESYDETINLIKQIKKNS